MWNKVIVKIANLPRERAKKNRLRFRGAHFTHTKKKMETFWMMMKKLWLVSFCWRLQQWTTVSFSCYLFVPNNESATFFWSLQVHIQMKSCYFKQNNKDVTFAVSNNGHDLKQPHQWTASALFCIVLIKKMLLSVAEFTI